MVLISPRESAKEIIAANMATRSYAFGRVDEATHPDSIRATLAEFVSTLIFVFAGEGSGLALSEYHYHMCSKSSYLVSLSSLVLV